MRKILYLGDTHLMDAAAYLAGLMQHWGWDFDYLPSDAQPANNQWQTEYGLILLSDYPATNLKTSDHEAILSQVAGGAGLLMIGGWESFHGQGGNWDGTPIGNALPVEIANHDDRRNCDRPVLLRRRLEHPITRNLPWEERPPVIGGFNQVVAKPEAHIILEACIFQAKREGDDRFAFELLECLPLLATGQYEAGRVAALMTDVAPHWVGPLVDWGTPRVSAQAPGSNTIEVGGDYARFFRQLLEWTAGNLD